MSKFYKVRSIKNIKDLFYSSCEEFSDRTAYLVKREGNTEYQPIKYKEVKVDVDNLGTSLIDMGFKGKRIAIISENRYEWAMSYFAVNCGVGIVVPLDRQLPEKEIQSCIERANVSVVIYSNKLEEAMRKMAEVCSSVEKFICMDETKEDDKFINLKTVLVNGEKLLQSGNKNFINAEVDEKEMSEMLFTSGTTAQSKIVMLSQHNICFNLEQMCKLVLIEPDDVFLSVLPIHHVYECTCGSLVPFYRGSAVAYCEGLRHIKKNMKESKVSVFLAVPLILDTIYKNIMDEVEKQGKTKLVKTMIKITNVLDKMGIHIKKKVFKTIHEQLGGNIKVFIAGAASVNPETLKGLRGLGIGSLQGYGLSECAPILALNPDKAPKDDAVGIPLNGVEVKIDNPNEEGVGEIIAKGENIMLGYYKNEEENKKALKDGWFYTGDLGFIDKDNYVHITGRKKNVIITKNGKNVYPEEIETILNDNEYIKESMVYGKKKKDDIIISVEVRLDDEYIAEKFKDSPKTEEEIKQIVWDEIKKINSELVIYKRIKDLTIRKTEFQKTTTMKIKRYLEVK